MTEGNLEDEEDVGVDTKVQLLGNNCKFRGRFIEMQVFDFFGLFLGLSNLWYNLICNL